MKTVIKSTDEVYYHGECKRCDCIFECGPKEVIQSLIYWYSDCPQCGASCTLQRRNRSWEKDGFYDKR